VYLTVHPGCLLDAARNPFEWSYDEAPTTVAKLTEHYLLVSSPVKMSYLAHIMRTQGPLASHTKDDEDVRDCCVCAVCCVLCGTKTEWSCCTCSTRVTKGLTCGMGIHPMLRTRVPLEPVQRLSLYPPGPHTPAVEV